VQGLDEPIVLCLAAPIVALFAAFLFIRYRQKP